MVPNPQGQKTGRDVSRAHLPGRCLGHYTVATDRSQVVQLPIMQTNLSVCLIHRKLKSRLS